MCCAAADVCHMTLLMLLLHDAACAIIYDAIWLVCHIMLLAAMAPSQVGVCY